MTWKGLHGSNPPGPAFWGQCTITPFTDRLSQASWMSSSIRAVRFGQTDNRRATEVLWRQRPHDGPNAVVQGRLKQSFRNNRLLSVNRHQDSLRDY